MNKENIAIGVGLVGLFTLVGLGTYASVKEAEEFNKYKTYRMHESKIRARIQKASIENDKLTIDRRYEANKVLEYYQAKAEKSVTRNEFDLNFLKLEKLIDAFSSDDRDYAVLSVMKATDQMRDEIAAKEKEDLERRHQEELRQQRANYEKLANAISGER